MSVSQESVEVGKRVVDSLSGLEAGGFASEVVGEVAVLAGLQSFAGVVEAEICCGVDGRHAATAVSGEMPTARCVIDGAVFSGFGFHGCSSVLVFPGDKMGKSGF
jgi:hypothetical protein